MAPGGLLHLLGDTGGLRSGLAALRLPGLAAGVLPVGGGRGDQVLGEVVRGAGLVRAVESLDLEVGQVDARVQLRDRRVVPLADLAVEDLGDRRGVQDQLVDARDVEADRDRAADHREVDALAATGAHLLGGDLFGLQRGVGAGEGDLALGERGDAGAGAAALVVDSCTPEQAALILTQASIAFFCADEPSASSWPLALSHLIQLAEPVVAPPVAVLLLPVSSEPTP